MNNRKCKISRTATVYALLVLFIIIIAVFENILPEENYSENPELSTFEADWFVVGDDGSRTPVTLPIHESFPRGEFMTIETVIPTITPEDNCIFLRTSQETCRFYVDGVLRYDFDTDSTRLIKGNSPAANTIFELSPEDSGHILRVEFMSNTHFSGLVNPFYIGSRFDIWYSILKTNFYETCADVFLLITGVIVVITGIILHKRMNQSRMFEMLGLVIISASLLAFTESRLRQLFFPNVSVIADMSYWVISMTMIAVAHYLDEVQEKRYTSRYMIVCIISLVDLAANYLLAFLNVIELFNSMTFTMVIVGALGLLFIINVFKDYRENRVREYFDIVVGVALFFVSVIFGNIFVNLVDVSHRFDIFVVIGLDIFIALGLTFLLIASVHNTAKNILLLDRDKQQAIYDKKLKERLFASISHDIRTPINGVMGLDETIIRDTTDPAIRESAKSIMNSSRMILSLVNDLLDFSKAESGNLAIMPRTYKTVDMLTDSISLIEDMVTQKELKFNIDIDPNIPSSLVGDDLRIKQIIINLLSNAVKYTSEGSVTLFVTFIRDESDRDCLRITVRDTGRGIREEDIPKLFDTFARFDEEENRAIVGTGLGLSITKNLIDLMDGVIHVESELGKGSVFTVLLPQKADDFTPLGDFTKARAERDESASNEPLTVCAPEAHILVVDDNPINLTVMKNLLSPTGVHIDLVNDGETSVDIARYKRFDLIFMDHMMPGMNGIEALALIRDDNNGLNTETPIIALTANETLGSCDMYKRYGFSDYLSKPVSTTSLMKMLSDYLPAALIEK